MKKVLFLSSLFILASLLSCNKKSETNENSQETPVYGEFRLGVDREVKTLARQEIDAFNRLYPNVQLEADFISESKTVGDLITAKYDAVLLGRGLDSTEIGFLSKDKIPYDPPRVAREGVALLIHPGRQDTAYQYSEFIDLLSGNTPSSNILLFPEDAVSLVEVLENHLSEKDSLMLPAYSTLSGKEVFEKVLEDSLAIGVVGSGWLRHFKETGEKFKVIAIWQDTGKVYLPAQAYISNGNYPFFRDIWYVSREGHLGPASGFGAYLTGESGQKIVLKSGLVPAIFPDREVNVTRELQF